MTVSQIQKFGCHTRRESGPPAKIRWQRRDSLRRFREQLWMLEARYLNLRTANRRYRRRNGLPFANA